MMDTLRSLLIIRKIDKIPNERVRELYGVKRGVDESVLFLSFVFVALMHVDLI